MSPTVQPLSAAVSSNTAIVFAPWRSSSEPSVTPSSDTTGKVAGSRPETNDVPPLMCTSPCRTCDTVSTSWIPRRSSAAAVLKPLKVGEVRMKSAFNVRSRISVVDALAEAPNTATNTTRPSPIISAEAVAAVRRGFRIEFSPPSLPGTPVLRIGSPMAPAIGRAINGVSIATPTNVSATPRPTSWSAFSGAPNSPYTSGTIPSASTTTPEIRRNRSERPGRSWASRSASIGATLAARRAGTSAAITVTSVPTTIETTKVRPRITVPDDGISSPVALRAPLSRIAIPMPASTPSSEDTTPITVASTMTEVITCRPLAPSARNSASSRVRWATMIANVLKMMKAPTNRATNAKTRKAVRRKPRPVLTWSCASEVTVAAVTASTPFGSTSPIRRCSSTPETPASATTDTESSSPSLPSTRCAVGRSNSAHVAPPRLSASPYPATPTTSNSPGGPSNTTSTRSPTWMSCACAVPASITTWSGPLGGDPPGLSVNPFSSFHADAAVGGPNVPITLPVAGSTICAYPTTSPSARATPGTPRTSSRTDSGIGSRSSRLLVSAVNAF